MGKKPNDDNTESEINEQFSRLTQPDEYFALFDLLQKYKWSKSIENKIEAMITEGFFKGDQIKIFSREVFEMDQLFGSLLSAKSWQRQYQALRDVHGGSKTGLSRNAYSLILNIRRSLKSEKRFVTEVELNKLRKVQEQLTKNAKPKTELEWILQSLTKITRKFLEERAYSNLGSSPLFSKADQEDLSHEVLIRLLRRGDYDHTAPRGVRFEYLTTILDSIVKNGRRAKLPGGVEITNENSRNIFSGQGEIDQSDYNTMRNLKKKSA